MRKKGREDRLQSSFVLSFRGNVVVRDVAAARRLSPRRHRSKILEFESGQGATVRVSACETNFGVKISSQEVSRPLSC